MTDDRAALAARHRPVQGMNRVPDEGAWAYVTVCDACGQDWGDKGCDTTRALALLDEEYERGLNACVELVRQARAEARALPPDPERLADALHAAKGWGDGITMTAGDFAAAVIAAWPER